MASREAQRTPGRFRSAVFWSLLMLLAVVGAWLLLRNAGKVDNDNVGVQMAAPPITRASLQQAVEAVAATEEADFSRAIGLWDQLIAAQPENSDFKLNQAIAVLKWINVINGEIGSGRSSPQELAQLNSELDQAYLQVERIIDNLAPARGSDYRAAFVEACLLELKALKAPSASQPQAGEATASELRKRAADVLAEQLQRTPGELLLAVKFDDLASQLEVEHPELSQQRATFLVEAFRKNPRNLFILKAAAEALMQAQDPRLRELLTASVDLAQPMLNEPLLARLVERLQPEQLVQEVDQAIVAGDWSKARRLTPWLNTLVSSSGFKADGKLAKPDVLAILETNFLADMADQLAEADVIRRTDLPVYNTVQVAAPATAVAWVDYDFDQEFEVVVASGNGLAFYDLLDGKIGSEPSFVVDLEWQAQGILPIDMFEVQLPGRPTLPSTVAELMQSGETRDALTPEQIDQARRHDTLQELLVWGDLGMRVVTCDENGTWIVLNEPTGLEQLLQVTRVVPADFESDGDLDLAIVSAGKLLLMQNAGNRSFQNISQTSQLPDACRDLVACDMDGDTDQDFVLIDPGQSQVVLLENLLHCQFRARPLEGQAWQTAADPQAIAIADVDNNHAWDVITTGSQETKIIFSRRVDDNTLTAQYTTGLPIGGGAVALEDLNNDGLLEVLVASDKGIRVASAQPTDDSHVSRAVRAYALQAQPLALAETSVAQLALLDANADGALELLALADQTAYQAAPAGPVEGNYLLVKMVGINDDNGGGRVNHYCVGSTLELWADGQQLRRVVRNPPTHFGLGQRRPDNLRVVFPNGLTQNLEKPEPSILIEEKQVPRGSCPYAYGWDGERFVMLTDLLWNAPLGLQIARGSVLPDRRWEYLLLPGDLMQPRDGGYELRITEELWEIAYFDHVQLTAVDHPADVRVFTNEKVGPPALAEPKLFATQQRIDPIAARDSYGRQVLPEIQAKDDVVVQAFQTHICQGLCEPHFLELDFGQLPVDERELVLFLTGWMYPTDTSLNIGIDQNSQRAPPEPPSLWVVDKTGQWVCAQPFMGFPGGKTKSIAVNLQGVFISDDHRLRIGSSQQIYWDEAFVAWHGGDQLARQQPLRLNSANLHYRGFSELLPRTSQQPHWFDYQRANSAAEWPSLEGPFTRFGDVLEILQADDDQMVVMVSGDEIALRFEMPDSPLPQGWVRDFILHSTGWDKDADLNTIQGQGSLPLPFKAQSAYPAPPEQFEEAQAVWRKNAATLTRTRQVDPAKPKRQR